MADGNDRVVINGSSQHVIGYLQKFLFSAERARTKVKSLSGGERCRLLLARLFTRPANLLVLDEPTNDLDIETLEFLEELLLDFQGTLLLVSHDRTFLNNVVTSTLVFTGEGKIEEYVGGYDDWQQLRKTAPCPADEKSPRKPSTKIRKATGKITFNEERELEALPEKIRTLEEEKKHIYRKLADPDFYRSNDGDVSSVNKRLQALENELIQAYMRWEHLEERKDAGRRREKLIRGRSFPEDFGIMNFAAFGAKAVAEFGIGILADIVLQDIPIPPVIASILLQ